MQMPHVSSQGGGRRVNPHAANGRPREANLEIMPLEGSPQLVEQLQGLDRLGDPRTLSGVPLVLEEAWQAQGLGPAKSRYGDTRWLVAWRILLGHALTGWNWTTDLRALELAVSGTRYSSTQQRAVVLLVESGLLQRHYLYLSRYSKRPDHRQAGFVWLTEPGLEMVQACGVDPAQVVQSDWIRMAEVHDPHDTQRGHTAHCVLAARLARAHGYQAALMPQGETPIQFDLRVTDPHGESWYVECEGRRLYRAPKRLRKWQALELAQEVAPVIALNPAARAALVKEIIRPGIPVRATDLFSLLQGIPEFWIEDDLRSEGWPPHPSGEMSC